MLGEIEEHLGVTIDAVSKDLLIPANEFDGKVVYGEKLKKSKIHIPLCNILLLELVFLTSLLMSLSSAAPVYQGHADVMKAALKDLNKMERDAQISFLKLRYGGITQF